MTQEQFDQQILNTEAKLTKEMSENYWGTPYLCKMAAKGVIASIIRLCVSHPGLAMGYYEKQPKAVME